MSDGDYQTFTNSTAEISERSQLAITLLPFAMVDQLSGRAEGRRRVEIRVLGPLEVAHRGLPVQIPRRQSRILLGILALDANRPVQVDRLIDLLWGTEPPENARTIVQIRISQIRSILCPDDAHGLDVRLEPRAGGYVLEAAPDSVDVLRFRDLLRRGAAAPADRIRAALALWRGPLLGRDAMPEITASYGQALEAERLTAIEHLLDIEMRSGDSGRVVDEFLPIVLDNFVREPLVARFLRALHQAGRTAEALKLYDQCRRWLASEFGSDPSKELHDAYREILAQTSQEPTAVSFRPAMPKLLPANVNDFTGRISEVTWIADRLLPDGRSGAALIAIAGPGGVGKTALAIHVAHLARARFPDGQLYVDLHGADDHPASARDVLGRFLRALGVDGSAIPEGQDERAELYRSLLADRRVLVLLDNARSDSQVAPLLPAEPLCAALITSRSRLGATLGAATLDLDVLDTVDATALLQRIVGTARTSATDGATAVLCDLVGRLPLAVRIVGAKLAGKPHWTVDRITNDLRDEDARLDHLVHDHLDVRATISVSYAGLEPDAQRAIRILSDLPDRIAGWQAAAALGIAPTDADLVLDQLVDAYLLDVAGADSTGTVLYHLHDLVRLFAAERARIEDPSILRRAYRERAHTALLAGLQAACRAANDGDHMVIRGDQVASVVDSLQTLVQRQPLAWFDSVRPGILPSLRQAQRDGNVGLCWEIAVVSSDLLALQRSFDERQLVLDIGMSEAGATGDVVGQAAVLLALGKLRADQFLADEALGCFERSLSLFESAEHQHGIGVSMAYVAMAHRFLGRNDEALEYCERALTRLTDLEEPGGRAHLLRSIGQIHLAKADFAIADDYFEGALGLCAEFGPFRRIEAQTQFWQGNLRLKQDRVDEAQALFTRVFDACREIGDVTGMCQALRGLSRCLVVRNSPERAREILLQALELAEQPRSTMLSRSIRQDLDSLGG
ncbi:AfsR/SARP family transcriptional regulator [Virgisporangium aurantiacum]|uniref:SARP family transcriptional regulator n=1 Tax=Virgisporangium aurantiacum TaxID=175570 RepID=A0A8J4DZQ3_9ACTN|nr:BTAD domain-containing putative transcriptional regulator [Virgisporangium aurantiacum]GIJ56154.1 SARP family transcriptional regulator [Virgisporangium aurantiacum]